MSASSDPIMDDKPSQTPSSHHNALERPVTLQLSSEQSARLFLQPSLPKSNIPKQLGNPTCLGILGFVIPFSCTVLSLLHFQGGSASSIPSLSGPYYFFGGLGMLLAAVGEFLTGNTFPFIVFATYGCHWLSHGYVAAPAQGIVAAYDQGGGGSGGDGGVVDGAMTRAFNAGQGSYFLVMAMASFVFLLGGARTNAPFVVVFFGLMMTFAFIAAGFYQLGGNPTPAGLEHTMYYFKIAGGFGVAAMAAGWYLVIIMICAATEVPCPLPIFELSQKVLSKNRPTSNPEDVADTYKQAV